MLRRRWPLIILGVGLGLAAAALIFAARVPEPVPFRFVGGEKPVGASAYKSALGLDEDKDLVYCFQANYDELAARAEKELEPLGYSCEYWEDAVYYTYWRRPEVTVIIHRDTRLSEAGIWGTEKATGWVTVVDVREPPPTFLERLTRLVGL